MKLCKICDEPFVPHTHKSECCCIEHTRKWIYRRNRIKQGHEFNYICEVCGDRIEPPKRKYCEDCGVIKKNEARKRHAIARKKKLYRYAVPQNEEKKCRRCGAMHRTGNWFYCGPCHTLLTDAFDPYAEGMDGFEYGDEITV